MTQVDAAALEAVLSGLAKGNLAEQDIDLHGYAKAALPVIDNAVRDWNAASAAGTTRMTVGQVVSVYLASSGYEIAYARSPRTIQ